jgi:hypothetical protein
MLESEVVDNDKLTFLLYSDISTSSSCVSVTQIKECKLFVAFRICHVKNAIIWLAYLILNQFGRVGPILFPAKPHTSSIN